MIKSALFLTPFVLVSVVLGGANHLWSLFPPATAWPAIIKSFDDPEEIAPYVKTYVAPLAEYQAAIRDCDIDDEELQQCAVAALNLTLDCLTKFDAGAEVFESQDLMMIQEVIENATAVFDDSSENAKVADLLPVMDPKVLQSFLFQRFNDMIINAVNEYNLQNNIEEYSQYCGFWLVQMKSWDPSKFRSLITRNLDFVDISEYTIGQLMKRYNTTMDMSELAELKYELHMLGNGALDVKPKQVVMISAIVMALCLVFFF